MDNIFVTQEIIHSLKRTKSPGMFLKLDMSKAFDKINWQYMSVVLSAFRFNPHWIYWIINLTYLALFSILVNGSPTPTFCTSRGIRQEDPLSPFLFSLMVEGLGRYISIEQRKNNLKGLRLHGEASYNTHHQGVDDTLLMGHPSVKESLTFWRILNDSLRPLEPLSILPNIIFSSSTLLSQSRISLLEPLGSLRVPFQPNT